MTFKQRHIEIREKARQVKAENDQLMRDWAKAEAPIQPGDIVVIPATAKIYSGMQGKVEDVSVLLAGQGLIYYWRVDGHLFNKDGNLTRRKFRFQIPIETESTSLQAQKQVVIHPKPKLDPLISGRLV